MAQITSIVSEALQASVRRLLPSQQGFTEDLQATNVITPIIDLTPTAEGSVLPYDLQTSLAFGSVTSFRVESVTTTLINNAGFYRVFGLFRIQGASPAGASGTFSLGDGTTLKDIYDWNQGTSTAQAEYFATPFDFVVFLRSGDLFAASCSNAAVLAGCYRQIADVNGNLINPDGFTPQ